MANNGERFEKLVKRLPLPWQDIVGMAVSYYINRHEPDKVVFKVHANGDDEVMGYSIQVRAEADKVKEAKEFWEMNVEGRL